MNRAPIRSLALVLLLAAPALAQDSIPSEEAVAHAHGGGSFSPYAGRDFPTRVLWGDQHLHTSVSVDAGTMCTLGQEEAFRFARGEEVTTTHGLRARLGRPLDWVVISDHAEMYGLMPQLKAGNPAILSQPTGRRWYDALASGDPKQSFATAMEIVGSLAGTEQPIDSDEIVRDAWRQYTALAERFNEPGRFSTIIGYEYTTRGGYNLHRNVLFRDGASVANRTVPFSQFDSQNPEDLWRALAEFEGRTGAEVMAIAHNGNLSNGRMFTMKNYAGGGLSRELAELRRRFEVLYEITQIKGDGESHPMLSPNDEFAGYEIWDKSNLNGTEAKTPEMIRWEYAREALKTGLILEKKLGVNPFKFGVVGGTDTHTALSTAEEDNFFGKHSGVEPGPHRWEHVVIEAPTPEFTIHGWQQAASGRAAVWATENTREAVYDAMKRKETYATTGSRIVVRFFGGWDFEEADAQSRLPAGAGYAKGVPMGSDLPAAPGGRAPSFFIAATRKDPMSGNLDRVQIVKGWLDAAGEVHEQVYDVAWGGDRAPGADGKLPPVGDTVDVATATWTNSIGAPELATTWTDPDFDPAERAFYYARVIEIPTPRWTAYEALRFGIEMSQEVPMKTQERAYTSPIWYNP
jgi:hypothetical protein